MSEDNSSLLSKMFQKAIDSEEYELLTINTICALLREDYEMVDKAIELILEKIKSENINQSLRALEILGECMTNGGEEFQDKVSKIRFLNRLIELVSKKYNGEKTPSEVRNKIMDYLLLWTTVYPGRTKIKIVYDKLCNEGVEHQIAHKSITVNASRKCSFLDEKADEKLKALLNSRNPKDLKLANLLIQYYVNQDAKRNELIASQNHELDKAKNVIDLLNEMINNNSSNRRSSDVGESMRELYERCLQFSPVIQRLPGIIDEKDEKLLAKALEINDDLSEVIMKYRALPVAENAAVAEEEQQQPQENVNECNDILLNPVSDVDSAIQMNDALDQNNYSSSKDLIFDNPLPQVTADNLLPLTLLEPVPIYKEQKTQNQTENTDLLQQKKLEKSETETSSFSYVNELVEDILSKHSNETAGIIVGAFKKKQPTKVSINELKAKSTKEILNKLDEVKTKNRTETLKTDQKTNINKDDDGSKDNLLVNASISEPLNFEDIKLFSDISSGTGICINSNSSSDQNEENFNKNENELKLKFDSQISDDDDDDEELIQMSDDKLSNEMNLNLNQKIENLMYKKNLADISLDLKSVKPRDNSPIIEAINDIQGIRMTCNLADNRLGTDIFVIVISIVNQSQFLIKNLSLDAAVKKPCRLRLLEPNKKNLPAFYVPHQLPTDEIKQILLLYNPTKKSIDVTFILSYCYPDDPDLIKEPAVATNIPYYLN